MVSTFLLYCMLGSIVVFLFFMVKLLIDLVSSVKALIEVLLMPNHFGSLESGDLDD